jgi:hypothetical protein
VSGSAPDGFARLDRDINHVIAYGQSLATGWEGRPLLSLRPRAGCLMLGQSVRGARESGATWVPVGERAAFRPLVATLQDPQTGRLVLRGDPVPGTVLGETVLEGAIGFWRERLGEQAGGRLLASACGVGGRALASLSRGAAPELFNRLRDCVRIARQTAQAEGASYGVAAVLVLQGESDVAGGGVRERTGYRALLHRLIDDIIAELADVQPVPPAVLLYQTGGSYAHDEMGVPQAQLDLALEHPGVVVAAPCYPYPSTERGHLDGNGYRWLGLQFGKVLHRVVTERAAWLPLHPVGAVWDGTAVQVRFHVPAPPLAWGRPFMGMQRADIADRGFTLLDRSGALPLAEVALAGPDSVRLVPARAPLAGPLALRYADRGKLGRGCLHDSDATVSDDVFVAHAPNATYAPEDAAALGGRPYRLANWCVGFTMEVTAG